MEDEVAPDTAHSAMITDHEFEPDGEWWARCGVVVNGKKCHLAESAHHITNSIGLENPPGYRCPECVAIRDMGGEMPHEEGKCPRE
jgi:hypothetical protein